MTWHFGRVFALVACGLVSAPAFGSPVFTYGFSVDTCFRIDPLDVPVSTCCAITLESLETSFISLTQDAVRSRTASYNYIHFAATPERDSFFNDGFVDISLPRPGGLGHQSYIPPSCTGSCETDIEVAIGTSVTLLSSGHFTTDSWMDNVRMTGLAGVWSGTLNSDRVQSNHFTGRWTLTRVVPEPDALLLALIALGLLAATTACRRLPVRGQRSSDR